MIHPNKHISLISPYALASLKPPAGKQLVSLSQNESLRPPSPRAISAASNAIASAHLYPDPDWNALRQTLADLHNISAGEILIGNGSMELILCIALAFCDKYGAILAPRHAYPFFKTAAQIARARYDTSPERKEGVCVDSLLDAVKPNTRIVFVANPGNPTGTFISRSQVLRLREGLRDDILLVIDEAYGEFVDHLEQQVFDLVKRGDTVVLRTFSKAYGLAGMRIGWGLFPKLVRSATRKLINPNNVSVAGQAAALAALRDQTYMIETCKIISKLRDSFAKRLKKFGFNIQQSFTNFSLIQFANSEIANSADKALRAEGVFFREQSGAGLAECLRATIGPQQNLNLAVEILEDWLKGENT